MHIIYCYFWSSHYCRRLHRRHRCYCKFSLLPIAQFNIIIINYCHRVASAHSCQYLANPLQFAFKCICAHARLNEKKYRIKWVSYYIRTLYSVHVGFWFGHFSHRTCTVSSNTACGYNFEMNTDKINLDKCHCEQNWCRINSFFSKYCAVCVCECCVTFIYSVAKTTDDCIFFYCRSFVSSKFLFNFFSLRYLNACDMRILYCNSILYCNNGLNKCSIKIWNAHK